jgi:hypothetical protein
MKNIELLTTNRSLEDYVLSRATTLPSGLIYNLHPESNLFKVLKTLFSGHRDIYLILEKVLNGLYTITEDNYYLDELLQKYGLPNILFPTVNSNKEKVFAINTMKLIPFLLTKKDFEDFLLLLGYKIKIYPSTAIKKHKTFNYRFPVTFSNSITKKDKLTFLVYVEENNKSSQEFNNIGDAFNIGFVNIENNLEKVKKILEYIKPCYIKFIYIDATIKNFYNL